MDFLESILQCPRCGSGITSNRCDNSDCSYSAGFPVVRGQRVLVDFDNSIFDRKDYRDDAGSVIRRVSKGPVRRGVDAVIKGENQVAKRIGQRMLQDLKAMGPRPTLLVIGGGAIGSGAKVIYEDENVQVVGTDVYASPVTQLVADGHALPFKDGSFDGVWIQAVLEHVLDPWQVASEIYRVLKPSGLIYADTPFLQHVHEGAYDFTRFTLSGHRWLFRRFEEIESGPVASAGTTFLWSARQLIRTFGLPGKLTTLAVMISQYFLFPFRFLDHVGSRRAHVDGANSVFFYGRKSTAALNPKAMIAYYKTSTQR